MNLQTVKVVDVIRELAAPIRARGVTSLAIFGSRARGDHEAGSDLDIMIDFQPGSGFRLLDLCAVERLIEERTGLTVQATTRSSMSKRFREAIDRDVIEVL
jgi:uncharacterized protein